MNSKKGSMDVRRKLSAVSVFDIHKLADDLAQQSQAGSGARLTPDAVNIALAALRSHADVLGPPKSVKTRRAFQIEALNSQGWPEEVLAAVNDEVIARAAFEAAVRQHPGRKLRLRQGARLVAESEHSVNIAAERKTPETT